MMSVMQRLILKLLAAVHYPTRVRLHIADTRLTERRCEEARHLIKGLMANPASEPVSPRLRTILMLVCANETMAITNRVLLENHLVMYEAFGIRYEPKDLNIDEVNASFEQAMKSLAAEGIK